jgi:hypothetical protein
MTDCTNTSTISCDIDFYWLLWLTHWWGLTSLLTDLIDGGQRGQDNTISGDLLWQQWHCSVCCSKCCLTLLILGAFTTPYASSLLLTHHHHHHSTPNRHHEQLLMGWKRDPSDPDTLQGSIPTPCQPPSVLPSPQYPLTVCSTFGDPATLQYLHLAPTTLYHLVLSFHCLAFAVICMRGMLFWPQQWYPRHLRTHHGLELPFWSYDNEHTWHPHHTLMHNSKSSISAPSSYSLRNAVLTTNMTSRLSDDSSWLRITIFWLYDLIPLTDTAPLTALAPHTDLMMPQSHSCCSCVCTSCSSDKQ